MKGFGIVSPAMGDILLTGADGILEGGRLMIEVVVRAPKDRRIAVNGVVAREEGERYCAVVPLYGLRSRIEARDLDGQERETVTVFWLKGAEGKYRFTVDDCIRCFEDITRNQDRYRSIFDNPYLAVFKEARDLYGSRVHINTFYENLDGSFNLSMMTDRFREEFVENADWLSITFHARGEYPDKPYEHASAETVVEDCLRCTREIRRFAGREVLRDTTTLHWGAANVEGVRALRALGFRALCGYLDFLGEEPLVSYHLTKEQVAYATKREGWADVEEDMVFPKLDLVLNAPELTAERVAPFLDELAARPHEGRFVQMVIHEQYFYPDYSYYEPDYRERVLGMAAWMREHGYESASLSDLIREDGCLC